MRRFFPTVTKFVVDLFDSSGYSREKDAGKISLHLNWYACGVSGAEGRGGGARSEADTSTDLANGDENPGAGALETPLLVDIKTCKAIHRDSLRMFQDHRLFEDLERGSFDGRWRRELGAGEATVSLGPCALLKLLRNPRFFCGCGSVSSSKNGNTDNYFGRLLQAVSIHEDDAEGNWEVERGGNLSPDKKEQGFLFVGKGWALSVVRETVDEGAGLHGVELYNDPTGGGGAGAIQKLRGLEERLESEVTNIYARTFGSGRKSGGKKTGPGARRGANDLGVRATPGGPKNRGLPLYKVHFRTAIYEDVFDDCLAKEAASLRTCFFDKKERLYNGKLCIPKSEIKDAPQKQMTLEKFQAAVKKGQLKEFSKNFLSKLDEEDEKMFKEWKKGGGGPDPRWIDGEYRNSRIVHEFGGRPVLPYGRLEIIFPDDHDHDPVVRPQERDDLGRTYRDTDAADYYGTLWTKFKKNALPKLRWIDHPEEVAELTRPLHLSRSGHHGGRGVGGGLLQPWEIAERAALDGVVRRAERRRHLPRSGRTEPLDMVLDVVRETVETDKTYAAQMKWAQRGTGLIWAWTASVSPESARCLQPFLRLPVQYQELGGRKGRAPPPFLLPTTCWKPDPRYE